MQQNSNNILFIDDQFENYIEILEIAASSAQCKLVPFNNIKDGLFYFNAGDRIDAVLLDIKFPDSDNDGIETLEKIKAINNLIPVIMLTGSDSAEDVEKVIECMNKGAYNYIGKQKLNPVYLFQVVNAAVEQYHTNLRLADLQSLKEDFRNREQLYLGMLKASEMIIKNILRDRLMFTPSYESRVKSFKSFYEKKLKKEEQEGDIKESFSRITDIAGLRVIFYNTADMENAVQLMKDSNDFVDIKTNGELIPDDKSKDYGYRAVHFDIKLNPLKRGQLEEYKMLSNIPCEVQFKTIFAHSWSKVHHALSYKEVGEMHLSAEAQEALNDDFRIAAIKLEDIEKQITKLSEKYFTQSKSSS